MVPWMTYNTQLPSCLMQDCPFDKPEEKDCMILVGLLILCARAGLTQTEKNTLK